MLDSAQSGDLGSHAAVDALRGCPGIHIHHADRPRIMARPAQPLHRTGNCARTADLQDLVYLAYIDTSSMEEVAHEAGSRPSLKSCSTSPAVPSKDFRDELWQTRHRPAG